MKEEEDTVKINRTQSMSRHCYKPFVVLSLIAACVMTVASAQETNGNPAQPVTSAIAPKVINIWPGIAPGSEQWKQKEATIHMGPMESIVNVTTPTLTAYLPDPSKATGTAVIIAPGGGFLFQGPNKDLAEWLAARGIAAFDLKYRTAQVEGENEAQLGQAAGARFGAQIRNYALIAEDGKYAHRFETMRGNVNPSICFRPQRHGITGFWLLSRTSPLEDEVRFRSDHYCRTNFHRSSLSASAENRERGKLRFRRHLQILPRYARPAVGWREQGKSLIDGS